MSPRSFSGMKIDWILKKARTFGRSPRLIVCCRGKRIEAMFLNGPETHYAAVSEDREFLDFSGKIRPKSVLLVLPRDEVILKEITLTCTDESAVLAEALQRELANVFPYPLKDMAYGLMLHPEAAQQKGWLYAIPVSKLHEILQRLKNLKIAADEIVTEDQTLSWLLQSRECTGTKLLLDKNKERILSLLITGEKIAFSQMFSAGFTGWLSELTAVVEKRSPPIECIHYTGQWDSGTILEIRHALKVPAQELVLNGEPVPAVMAGGRFWGDYPLASLLPSEEKVKNRERLQKKNARNCAAQALLILACVILAGNVHLTLLQRKGALLKKSMERSASEVRGIKTMAAALQRFEDARVSKSRLLDLLKELALTLPGTIRFKDLRTDNAGMVFSGECPSHPLLMETVQNFEKIKTLKEVRLEHTRLRKRLNQDYLEFEVNGKWRL